MNERTSSRRRKPPWLKKRISTGDAYFGVLRVLSSHGLHTVCQEALCPNMGECFTDGTATFLILGNRCTRSCSFCAVEHSRPSPPDPMEPLNVAKAVDRLGLDFVVITSVSRDDLPDGGASHFASTIELIRGHRPQARVEVLIPDFSGSRKALETVLGARPDVLNHNLETVRRLYPRVRPGASYERSLDVFRRAGQMAPGVVLKSGLMLGLGEHEDEILQALEDLLEAGCDVITLGQYLQPTPRHLPVARFVHPDEFDRWRSSALELGFKGAACGPFVRSSYHAHRLWAEASALSP